jgi:SAM-dependent methyltransferase
MKLCPRCSGGFTSESWQCPACGWSAPRQRGIVSISGDDTTVEGFDESLFPLLSDVEQHHFWFAARVKLLEWVLDQYFPTAGSFLEVGAGTGHVARALRRHRPGMKLSAVEPFRAGLEVAAARGGDVELIQADALQLPYSAEFDVVGAFDVIEHIENDQRVLREMASAVVPGGGVVITVPQHRFLWGPFDEYAHHCRRYTRRELVDRLKAAGLNVRRVTSFVSLLLPAMLASRVHLARRDRQIDPADEFRISPVMNRIAAGVMSAERLLIRSGISWPAGGSLLAVATRPLS